MSYGNSVPDAYRQAGVYAGRILNGAPSLPICRGRAALKIAKALGLTVPDKCSWQPTR
jgi:hypothetical protein